MRIHAYQAKELFARHGLPVAASSTASTVDEAVAAADSLGFPVVVKAQIHAGGRGRGAGYNPSITSKRPAKPRPACWA